LNVPIIFLVDDDEDYQQVNRVVLESAGYHVVCFACPDDAMLEAERNPPDLLITDLMMGSLDDGLQLSRAIKTHPRLSDVPVLIVTGMGRELGLSIVPRGQQELDALYANAFLEKPTAPATLLKVVKRLLG
jgi:CheY-like chemotaxis protein